MRLPIAAFSALIIAQTLVTSLARSQEAADSEPAPPAVTELDQPEASAELDSGAEAELRGSNRWVCTAEAVLRGHPRTFRGASDWFAAGSGRGQAAHQQAYDRALDECRREFLVRECVSNFTRDCSVQRN